LIADAAAWFRAEADDALISLRTSPGDEDHGILVRLHPAADELEVTASESGGVTVRAPTGQVGPGYHTYIGALVHRLGTDLDIDWAQPDAEAAPGDDGYLASGARADAERHLLVWLHDTLARAKALRTKNRPALQLAGSEGERFSFEGAIATALGPRDEGWLDAAIGDPRVAIEAWPWWADATDGRYLLNRALCLMWTEVRWRPPATEGEIVLLDEVLRLLRKAFPFDPSLPYPWGAWQEILKLRGASEPMAAQIASRAQADSHAPQIGYRRQPVTVTQGGWSIVVPGTFTTSQTADEWSGAEAGRIITLAAAETSGGGGSMSADAFLERVAGHLGKDVLKHRDGPVVGRARIVVDASTGVEVAVLDGYSAVAGSCAAIRIEIHDPEDWGWATDMWRSLKPAPPIR
jgi:hypothetical protein